MNDLGLTLAWLAVQVALLLVPALALHALASRRGPARGAWVAALSLGLVVALNAAAFVPGIAVRWRRLPAKRSHRRRCRPATIPHEHPTGSIGHADDAPSGSRTGLDARVAAAGLGPARARGGRAGGAVPAVGEHPGGRRAGRDRRRAAPPDARALGGRPLPPPRAAGRRPGDDRTYSTSCGRRWDVAGRSSCARCPT